MVYPRYIPKNILHLQYLYFFGINSSETLRIEALGCLIRGKDLNRID